MPRANATRCIILIEGLALPFSILDSTDSEHPANSESCFRVRPFKSRVCFILRPTRISGAAAGPFFLTAATIAPSLSILILTRLSGKRFPVACSRLPARIALPARAIGDNERDELVEIAPNRPFCNDFGEGGNSRIRPVLHVWARA